MQVNSIKFELRGLIGNKEHLREFKEREWREQCGLSEAKVHAH